MVKSLKSLLMEIIVEASIGKKFPIFLTKNGKKTTYIGIASANTKPGERPYRITWFTPDLSINHHVDLTLNEMISILEHKTFPVEIVQRIQTRYPKGGELVGDQYVISI
jgi:hypothetical protein